MIVGGIDSSRINSTKFTSSIHYMQDELTWCVSKAKPLPEWQNFLHAYTDIETWVLSSILYIGAMAMLYFMSTFEAKPIDCWATLLISIQTAAGSASTFNPQTDTLRFFYLGALCMALLLGIYLNAFMVTLFTTMLFHKQIDSVTALGNGNFKLAGHAFIPFHLSAQDEVRFFNRTSCTLSIQSVFR